MQLRWNQSQLVVRYAVWLHPYFRERICHSIHKRHLWAILYFSETSWVWEGKRGGAGGAEYYPSPVLRGKVHSRNNIPTSKEFKKYSQIMLTAG